MLVACFRFMTFNKQKLTGIKEAEETHCPKTTGKKGKLSEDTKKLMKDKL